jgi:hypothetical protein
MSKERDDRYGSVRDLQEALRPFADRALPARIGAGSALALEGTLMSDASPPRVSSVSTPMTVDDRTKPPEDAPARTRWPLFAGVGLAVVGVVGLVAALGGGMGAGGTPESADDASVRGLVAEDGAVEGALAEGIEIPADTGAPVVVDAAADVAEASDDLVRDDVEETGAMERVPMGMGMRGDMSTNNTTTMDGIVVDDTNPF